jgi:hypothetical protein
MQELKKRILISEANALTVMKSHYEVSLACIQSRLGDINTELMFAESNEAIQNAK